MKTETEIMYQWCINSNNVKMTKLIIDYDIRNQLIININDKKK